MKSLPQLLLYPYKTSMLCKSLIEVIDPNLMTVPSNIIERILYSDELLGLPSKDCKTTADAAKWLIAEAVVYEKVSCIYLDNNQLVYINNLWGKQSFIVEAEKLTGDYIDKLKAAFLIRWGASLKEQVGDFIKVIDTDNKEYITTPFCCDCSEFEKNKSCSHTALVKLFLKDRNRMGFVLVD